MMKLLRSGGSSDVYILENSKRVRKIYYDIEIYKNEKRILELLKDEPQVMHMLDSGDNYIELEYCDSYVDLFDYLTEDPCVLNEEQCKVIFEKIVKIVVRLFKNGGIIHGDIKDENILIDPEVLDIKIIDFGTSFLYGESFNYISNNTMVYRPPEAFLKRKVDPLKMTVWSLGTLLFTLIEGKEPFLCKKEIIHYKKIKIDRKDISPLMIDLVQKLLEPDESQRLNLVDILHHPWFK